MCVIIHSNSKKKRPTLEILQKCERKNDAGGGVAWFEGNSVHWEKGATAQRIHDILQSQDGPAVAHFRLATVGGKGEALCHPFPISPKAETFKKGYTHEGEGVLFHNGHVHDWDRLYAVVCRDKLTGPVSDTRAIAAILAQPGVKLSTLDVIKGGVYAVMKNGMVRRFGIWTKRDGIWYSNTYWETTVYHSHYYGGAARSSGAMYYNWEDWHVKKENGEWVEIVFPLASYSVAGSTHLPSCCCNNCNDQFREDRSANGWTQHKHWCKCVRCVDHRKRNQLQEPILGTIPPEKRTGSVTKPAGHGDDCRCQDCRIAKWHDNRQLFQSSTPGDGYFQGID